MVSYKDEWHPGIHNPIIDEETFNKAQQILAERDAEANAREPRINSVIAGLVQCGHCDNKYFHRLAKSGDKEWGYYTCYKRTANTGKWKDIPRDQRCKNKNWKSADLEEKVLGEIRKLALHPDEFEIETFEDDNTAKIKVLADRIKNIESQVSKLMDLYSIGGIDFEIVQKKIQPLVSEKETLAIEIRNLEVKDDKMSKDEAVEIALSLCDVIDDGDTDEIKFLIRELIEKIAIDNDKIHIYWKFA